MMSSIDYGALDRLFSFVAASMYRSAKHERIIPMTRLHTRYTVIVNDMTVDMKR